MEAQNSGDYFANAMRDAKIAYWNSLLVVNSIVVSIFTAIALFTDTNIIIILLLILSCFVSIFLVVSNYKLLIGLYDTIEENRNNQKNIDEKYGRELIITQIKNRKKTKLYENIATSLLVLQCLFIIFILLNRFCVCK